MIHKHTGRCHDPLRKYVEEGGQEQTSLSDSKCCLQPVSYAAIEEDCIGGLLIEVFDDSNKVGLDAGLFDCCPTCCMPNPVEGLLEGCEDMAAVLLVLELFLTKDSQVEYLLCGTPSSSEACLFFLDDLNCLQLQSVQYASQHDFALMVFEAAHTVVLALLQVAFLGKCDDQGLGPRGLPFSCQPDLAADAKMRGSFKAKKQTLH